MTGSRAADDFPEIRKRMEELRRTEGLPQQPARHYEQRGSIGIAGPAGNPTQPTGAPTPASPPAVCKHPSWEYIGAGRYKCKTCDKEEDFCGDGESG